MSESIGKPSWCVWLSLAVFASACGLVDKTSPPTKDVDAGNNAGSSALVDATPTDSGSEGAVSSGSFVDGGGDTSSLFAPEHDASAWSGATDESTPAAASDSASQSTASGAAPSSDTSSAAPSSEASSAAPSSDVPPASTSGLTSDEPSESSSRPSDGTDSTNSDTSRDEEPPDCSELSNIVGDDPPCDCLTTADPDGNQYMFCIERVTRAVARERCEVAGGRLASIHSADQHAWLQYTNFQIQRGTWWIGLTDAEEEGTYEWDDGTPLDFEMWHEGEPNDLGGDQGCGNAGCGEDCVVFTWDAWNDLKCGEEEGYLCAF